MVERLDGTVVAESVLTARIQELARKGNVLDAYEARWRKAWHETYVMVALSLGMVACVASLVHAVPWPFDPTMALRHE